MRIAYFGHRSIACGPLEAMLSGGREVVGIVAHPEDSVLSDPEWSARVRALAGEAGVPLETPEEIDEEFLATFRGWNVDLGVVVGYLSILRPSLLEIPRRGFINIHAGLLPRYRGRAPLAWAIMNGDKEAGLSIHVIDEGVDSGPVIAQRKYAIGENETSGELYQRIQLDIPGLVMEVVDRMEAGPVEGTPQDEERAMCFPLVTPAHARIDWARPAARIHDQVRALSRPYPGAWTLYRGRKLTVWRTSCLPSELPDCFPGTVVGCRPGKGVVVSTGSGYLLVEEVQRDSGEPRLAWKVLRRAGVSLGLDPSELEW
ncbi:MAG: methionyl-tRNA formyltransferase [Candidatus Eisenbacteria sp.]|nr:methionyl-tRNA formyltransferase [Candidatus Eisenbacteria bacterium]